MTRIAVAVLLLSACNTGNNFVAEGQPDLATATTVVVTPDLGPAPPDLLIPGPSCGQVAMCVLGCGQDPTCFGGCITGVDPQTFASLGNLLLCAGTSCLTGLGGGDGGLAGGLGNIDTTQLFLCLAQSCATQLSMCGGLFGGFGGGQ
jgi:hypothetical protein